jgi:opacity protein-like surface antigen
MALQIVRAVSHVKNFRLSALAVVVAALSVACSLHAQTESEHKWDAHAGAGVSPLVGDISDRLNTGWHFTVGGGYNLAESVGVTLEYMYNGFGVKKSVLNALNVPSGDAHMQSVTINPIWRFKTGGRLGAYVIVGGGYYRRTVEFTQPTLALVDVFDPWWGYVGPVIIPVNRVIGSATSNAGGANAGLGMTIGLGGGVKFYSEIRYHYAATHRSRTQILPVTFGLRW